MASSRSTSRSVGAVDVSQGGNSQLTVSRASTVFPYVGNYCSEFKLGSPH